ncbi:MAG: hypothetical protein SF162_12260 [bacterium]|nr:hypothetical protein [bacterium]
MIASFVCNDAPAHLRPHLRRPLRSPVLMIVSSPVASAPHRALVPDRPPFAAFSNAERRALIAHLFAVLPQRGCEQRCAGCHAAALPRVTAAEWSTAVQVIERLGALSAALRTPVQANVPNALVETFRDSDPAHLRMTTADGERRGIGAFGALIHRALGRPFKVMTSGARARRGDPDPVMDAGDLAELEQAAFWAGQSGGRMSVSASVETRHYRTFGAAGTAFILARTLESILRGAQAAPHPPEIFLDMMVFAPNGDDPLTAATLDLMRRTLDHVDAAWLRADHRDALHRLIAPLPEGSRPFDGVRNQRLTVPGVPFGIRVSPHLNIGRAARTGRGQALAAAAPTDWLGVLPGDPDDALMLDGIAFTRRELHADPAARHAFIQLARRVVVHEPRALAGNPLTFFRAEIDLPGERVNLLVSDPYGGDLQAVIPYKPIY